jgi:flagellar motor switch protein FliN/FliY
VLSLGPDSAIELDRKLNDPVDIRINGMLVAQGDLVKVDGSLGVRITGLVQDPR